MKGKGRASSSLESVENLWLIEAKEVGAVDSKGNNVFRAEEPSRWTLLTTLRKEECFSIEEVVRYYSLRWRVEQLHYVLKSGALNVERRQFDDVGTFINALAFYSIIGWRILYLTYRVRADAEAEVGDSFDTAELTILQSRSGGKKIKTIGQAVVALGRLSGFSPSKKQPYPGIKILATALERLATMKEGFLLANNISLQD